MTTEILNKLYAQFKENPTFSYTELYAFMEKEFPDLAEKTISWKIYKLKTKGILSHISRGIYSLTKKKVYTPHISSYLKRIYKKITSNLPYLNVCIWDSSWFNEFMVHQLFKYSIVVETEKDAVSPVFNILTDISKNVFINPDGETFNRYINNNNEVIIVKPLISEAPVIEINKIRIPSIEKLLIDCLIDKDLFATQQDEMDSIYKTVFDKYLVNLNRLKRYARRRDHLVELENKIKKLNLTYL